MNKEATTILITGTRQREESRITRTRAGITSRDGEGTRMGMGSSTSSSERERIRRTKGTSRSEWGRRKGRAEVTKVMRLFHV